jgi:hypothetical protein
VQEFIPGQTLHDRCRDGVMAPHSAAAMVASLAETLHFVHRRGFVHRDLSPTNVLVDGDDFPHLLDFGLCVSLSGDTDESIVGGTRNYMALESLLGVATSRVDIWALGALLYELLTGERLEGFGRDSNASREHLWDSGHLLSSLTICELPDASSNDIPAELGTICRRCLTLDADDRYCTAGSLAAALQRYLVGVSVAEAEPRVLRPQERLLAWRLGVGLGSLSYWHRQSHSLMDKILENPSGNREVLRWVITRGLGYDIVAYAHEHAAAQHRDWEVKREKALKYQRPEFEALEQEVAAILARLKAGEVLDEKENARVDQYFGSVVDFSFNQAEDVILQHLDAIGRGLALVRRLNDEEEVSGNELTWLREYVDDVKRRVEESRRDSVILTVVSDEEERSLTECALWAANCLDAQEAAKNVSLFGPLSVAAGVQEEAKRFFCQVMLYAGEPIGLDQELRRFYGEVDLRLVREIPYERPLD